MAALRAIYKGEGVPGGSCLWLFHLVDLPFKNSRFLIN
jgi:hypothetical protein